MARRAYRMTPRRRAALRKAQQASARKRRRNNLKAGAKLVGVAAGAIAVGAARHHIQNYAYNPGLAVKHGKAVKTYAKNKFNKGPKVDPNAPGIKLRSHKPLRYYGRGRAAHIRNVHTMGSRIKSR